MPKVSGRLFYAVAVLAVAFNGRTYAASINENLSAAAQPCVSREWPDWASKMNCLTTVEGPIIAQQAPFALASFQRFAARRLEVAKQADVIGAVWLEQSAKYKASYFEAFALLKAHEPKLLDSNSSLVKEWNALGVSKVCASKATLLEQVNCIDNILRPVWLRNVPNTVAFYDELQSKHRELARRYDASGAQEAKSRSLAYLNTGLQQAGAKWRESYQKELASQQNAVAGQETAKTVGELLAAIAQIGIAVAEIKAGR